MVPFGFTNPLTHSTTLYGHASQHGNNHQNGQLQHQQRYPNGTITSGPVIPSSASPSAARIHSRNIHANGPSIQLLGDWIPKMTDTFIMSRLYTGVDGKADTWRPAQDISRLLTLSKFIELRERIERHRETTDFPSNTKPPLLRYALIAVVKLTKRNPPLLQVTDLPANAFNHPMMPPCDRLNNDLTQPVSEQIQNPCVGFQQTKWALTEAGKRWVEEHCHKVQSNKRKASGGSEANETVKLPRIELLSDKASAKQSLELGLVPLQTPLQNHQSQQLQQMQQLQQQISPLLTTALLGSIQTMQERLGLLESLYSTLHQQHQVLQEEHNVLRREHQELQDKVSTAKQMTKLIEIDNSSNSPK